MAIEPYLLTRRLQQIVNAAGIPNEGVHLLPGRAIDYLPAATAQQRIDGQAILDAFDPSDAAQTAWENLQARATAKTLYDETLTKSEQAKLFRALVAVLLDEINTARSWIAAFKVEVAASTNLANLQSRTAALPAMPARTAAQAKTAILNKLDGGTVD